MARGERELDGGKAKESMGGEVDIESCRDGDRCRERLSYIGTEA